MAERLFRLTTTRGAPLSADSAAESEPYPSSGDGPRRWICLRDLGRPRLTLEGRLEMPRASPNVASSEVLPPGLRCARIRGRSGVALEWGGDSATEAT